MDPLVAHHSHQLTAADGTALFVTDYLLPAGRARGSVMIMHGLGEHSGRYRHVARFFNDCGLSVRCYDHRGHGRSGGARGDVHAGDPIVQDAGIVFDDFATRFPLPPYLFGHSMGGLFAARFALSGASPLRGLILSSPALAVHLNGLQRAMLGLMERMAPALALPNGLSPRFLSHDAKVVAAYRNDPLVHGKISARLMRSMLSAIAYCQSNAQALKVPALLLVAGDDRLVDAEGSRRFHAALPARMARMHLYDGFYHELFNEVDAERPLSDLRSWLGPQLALQRGGAAAPHEEPS
jgi:alpha-beta hydrolase superfamily lysophospholipase